MGEASPAQCMRCRRAQAPSSCTPVQRFLVAAAVISSARERIRGSRRDPRWARPPASVGGKVEGASRPTFHTHTSKSQHQRGRQLTKASQHTHGISRAKSFDLEVTPWAPARLTSCISHPGPEGSYGASTLPPGPAQPPSASNFPPNRPASLCLLHTRGISRARSFDLEVTPSAPTRLTSYISHIDPEESSGASTLSQTAQARP